MARWSAQVTSALRPVTIPFSMKTDMTRPRTRRNGRLRRVYGETLNSPAQIQQPWRTGVFRFPNTPPWYLLPEIHWKKARLCDLPHPSGLRADATLRQGEGIRKQPVGLAATDPPTRPTTTGSPGRRRWGATAGICRPP